MCLGYFHSFGTCWLARFGSRNAVHSDIFVWLLILVEPFFTYSFEAFYVVCFCYHHHRLTEFRIGAFAYEKWYVDVWAQFCLHFFNLQFYSTTANHVILASAYSEASPVCSYFGNVVCSERQCANGRCIYHQASVGINRHIDSVERFIPLARLRSA